MESNKSFEKNNKMEINCSKCGKPMKEAQDLLETSNISNTIHSMCVHCNALFCNECMANETENRCHKCKEDTVISITYNELNKLF